MKFLSNCFYFFFSLTAKKIHKNFSNYRRLQLIAIVSRLHNNHHLSCGGEMCSSAFSKTGSEISWSACNYAKASSLEIENCGRVEHQMQRRRLWCVEQETKRVGWRSKKTNMTEATAAAAASEVFLCSHAAEIIYANQFTFHWLLFRLQSRFCAKPSRCTPIERLL